MTQTTTRAVHGVPLAAVPAAEPGRRHRKRDTTTLRIARVASMAAAEAIRDDWYSLYAESAPGNPFASPDWLLTWARHFVAEADLAMSAVWRDGRLIGLAPWYVKRSPVLPRRLQLLGSGRHDSLTELPQVLAAPGEARSVLRAVIGERLQAADEWAWLELPVMWDQGWFEPEWLTGAVGQPGLVQHKITRAEVVLDLPSDVRILHRTLKRNLIESTHRARNRLGKAGQPWSIAAHENEEQIRNALPILAGLHAARATAHGRRSHPDQLTAPARYAFLEEAALLMARKGQARILTLDVAGKPVAAQLVLMTPTASYLSFSGVDPAFWHVSGVTLLHMRAAEDAIGRGHRSLSLSVGPSVYKLRWSEQIRQNPEFLVCGRALSSRLAYTGYRMAATAAGIHREAVRHQVAGRKKGS